MDIEAMRVLTLIAVVGLILVVGLISAEYLGLGRATEVIGAAVSTVVGAWVAILTDVHGLKKPPRDDPPSS